MKTLISALSGALFGTGLLVSGMTDAAKVQGFLALIGPGAWDPTLAFVMGGAMLPMAIAWRLSASRTPLFAGSFPSPTSGIDTRLIGGSVMFGIGWGLIGLCPGPALAALLWGGWPVALFTVAMAAGMLAAPPLIQRFAPS